MQQHRAPGRPRPVSFKKLKMQRVSCSECNERGVVHKHSWQEPPKPKALNPPCTPILTKKVLAILVTTFRIEDLPSGSSSTCSKALNTGSKA